MLNNSIKVTFSSCMETYSWTLRFRTWKRPIDWFAECQVLSRIGIIRESVGFSTVAKVKLYVYKDVLSQNAQLPFSAFRACE